MKSILKYSKAWVAGAAVVSLAACQSSAPEPAAEARAPIDVKTAAVASTTWPTTHEAGGVVRAHLVAVGGRADVRIDRGAGEAEGDWQQSTVAEVANIDPARHSFTVKVNLPAAEGLRSGLFGRVRVLGPSRTVLAAPRSAIVRRGQLSFAFVVDGEGSARLRMVSVGEESGGEIEVLAGLHEGDQVVLDPPASLEDGRPVRGAARATAAGEAK